MNWQCASYSFDVKMPIVMGILNVTPDSFSDGGEHNTHDAAIAHAKSMIDAGAKIIDVGGESTRPGSAEVSVAEELSRTVDIVRELAQAGICVSIDTRHAERVPPSLTMCRAFAIWRWWRLRALVMRASSSCT